MGGCSTIRPNTFRPITFRPMSFYPNSNSLIYPKTICPTIFSPHGFCPYTFWSWQIPGKVKLLLISGKKSASLLDHISRFLSHQFVTWYLRSISKTKIVKLFCPCMSEHMIYIKNVTNVTQTLHQNVTNGDQTKYCIKRNPDDRISYEVYEIVCKYVVRHLDIAQYKIP